LPVTLATQKAEIRRIAVGANQGKQFTRWYLKNPFTKIGLVEWLKVKVLSSSPCTNKTKQKNHYFVGCSGLP
jgi:hypothetical protein